MTTASTLQRVERVCVDLHQAGDAVTFTAVAARTGLSRTTLYRNPALRAVVDQHRHHSTSSGTLIGLTEEIAMFRTALDALATRVRAHEEQLRRLRPRRS